MTFDLCAGEGGGCFGFYASEHEFPQIPVLLQAPMFTELAGAMLKLGMPDSKVGGAGICGGNGGSEAELSKGSEAG